MRYKVVLSYDGNEYVGFQSQKNGVAIQDVIEDVIYKIFSERTRIIMSSRTDSGVHAKYQVIHFDASKKIDPYRLKGFFNGLLPKTIHVSEVKIVSEKFHARFNVKTKTYEYLINNGEYDVFLNGYAYQCNYHLDIELMKKCAKLFIGKHDFTSFNTTPLSEKENQTRTITKFDVTKKKGIIKVTVTGDGFLKNMVRIMVGCLVDVARGQKEIRDIKEMLKNPSKDYKKYNIDANGLYLVKIRY